MKLTMAQALVKFLDNQYVSFDGKETKFVNGIFGIFGHGCVVGIGQALEQGGHSLTYYQGHNEQGMAHAAIAFAKQKHRREIIACTSSIGPGALNMVTACGTASANRIPLLVLPGDTFACRQPDPVLQQIEQYDSVSITSNDAFRAVCKYWDRIERPEQLMTACINAMRVLTDPADTGAVCIAMPQDVEGEAFDYPEHFLKKRVWYMDRKVPSDRAVEAAAEMVKAAKKPMMVIGGGVTYSESWKQALAFAEKYNIPIGETQAGKGQIPFAHPLNMGGCGVTGTASANAIAKQADLVIAVGTRLTDFTTCSKWGFQNPQAKMLSINVCPFDAFKMDSTAVIGDAGLSLDAIGAKIGADIPFCLTGGTRAAQNIGDVLSPLPDLKDCYIVLAKPEKGVATGKAFSEFDKNGVRHLDTCSMLYYAANGDFEGICSKAGNVFEQLIEVPQRVPIKSVMYDNNAVCACMSGSGPTCYGIFKNEDDAKNAYEALKKDFKETYLCTPVNSGLIKVQ